MTPQIHEYKKINKSIIFFILFTTIVFTACSNATSDKKENGTTVASVDTTTKQVSSVTEAKGVVSIKEILANYLQMKNAFAKDNAKDAANAGNDMVKSFANFNKAALTADQVKIYNDIQDDAKEHAEHIGMNAGKIEHQREHFDMLSKDIYQLVKAFGGEQKLYYDHCPMYNDGKGANWLSESKDISNPYLGKKMSTCGTVKEELQ